MDPLTHCLLGGVAAKSVKSSPRRFWIMTILGMAPDIDVLANFLGSWAFAFQHRGMTHSVVGLVLQSVFYAWAFSSFDKGRFRDRAGHYSLPLTLHVLCDFLTAHGVPLLSPFSFQDFSADLVVAVSLIPMIFMAVGLFWLHTREKSGWKATRPVWVAWGLYLFLALSGKAFAVKLAVIPNERFTTLPSAVNPFKWRSVVLDPKTHTYQLNSIDLLKRRRLTSRQLAMPGEDFPVQASLKSRAVKEFLRDNRWPVVRIHPRDDGWRVEWGNLLFSTQGMIRSKVVLDIAPNGTILSERKTFGFWDPDQQR